MQNNKPSPWGEQKHNVPQGWGQAPANNSPWAPAKPTPAPKPTPKTEPIQPSPKPATVPVAKTEQPPQKESKPKQSPVPEKSSETLPKEKSVAERTRRKKWPVLLLAILLLGALAAGIFLFFSSRNTTPPAPTDPEITAPTHVTPTIPPDSVATVPTISTEATEDTQAPDDSSSEEENEGTNTYLHLYQDVIDDYTTIIRYRLSDSFMGWDPENDHLNISDTLKKAISNQGELEYRWSGMIAELPASEMAQDENYYGYILHDLNADEIPELFWVRYDHSIVAIFTYYNDSVTLLDAYWTRSRSYVSQNNALYSPGSSGAADNSCIIYTLDNGKLKESYGFSSESNWETNTVHYFEFSESTKTEISLERYSELSSMYPSQHSQFWLSIPVNPLSPAADTEDGTAENQNTELPYTQKVPRADQSIWDGPGYNYSLVGTVEVSGIYTITAEVQDSFGNLWGKLKSGAGWIDLSEVRSGKSNRPEITINYAEDDLLSSGNYHHCVVDAERGQSIVISANTVLKNAQFFASYYNSDIDSDVPENLYFLPEMTPTKPLVIDVSLRDASEYYFRFTDNHGTINIYAVSISGIDGTLVLSKIDQKTNSVQIPFVEEYLS